MLFKALDGLNTTFHTSSYHNLIFLSCTRDRNLLFLFSFLVRLLTLKEKNTEQRLTEHHLLHMGLISLGKKDSC